MQIDELVARRLGKMSVILGKIQEWIIQKKRFVYHSNDYIVVGMPLNEWKKKFTTIP